MPNSNKPVRDFKLEAITVQKRLVRNDERAEDVIPNQCFKR